MPRRLRRVLQEPPVLKLLWALLMGAASVACALAAVGWTLYAPGPQALPAALLFGAWGAAAGLACGLLQWWVLGRPAPAPAPAPAAAVAAMLRAALAQAAAERQARPGSAADRQPADAAPAPAPVPVPLQNAAQAEPAAARQAEGATA